jgi:hypothetical protein
LACGFGNGQCVRANISASVPMQILARLKADRFKRFRAIVDPDYDVRSVDLATLELRLGEADAKLIVVDPSRMRPESFLALVETARAGGNAAVLVHAQLTLETARVVVAASRIQPIEAIFFGSYDERDALAKVLERLMVPSVQALMLRGLAANLGEMPPVLATRIVGMFGGQHFPPSTSAMLDGFGVTIDTAREWLTAAGITHPHYLRSSAVLARIYPELAQKRNRLGEIVEQFDAGSERALRRACATLASLSPRQAGRLARTEFARRLLSVVLGLHDPDRVALRQTAVFLLGIANAPLLAQTYGELSGGWGVVGTVPSSAAGSFTAGLALRASLLLQLADNPSVRFDALLLQVNRQAIFPQPCPSTGCTQANVTTLNRTIAGLSANAIVNLNPRGTVYAVAGGGGYDENILSDEYHLGLSAGIGFALPLGGRVRLIGEAQWLAIIGGTYGPSSMVPITLGIRF